MKNIHVVNNKTGMQFNFRASGEYSHSPAWGKPERWVHENMCSDEDKQSALNQRDVQELDKSHKEYLLPAEFTITETDASQDLINEKMAKVREERDRRLAECDWTQLADAPLNMQQKIDWRTYRQALRDVPNQMFDPAEAQPVWPEKPQ